MTKEMYSIVLTVFVAVFCAETSRVAADVSAKDLTCNFNRDYCGWINDTSMTGVFLRESNATNYRIIPTGCNFLLATSLAGSAATAKLDSPPFTIMESTVVVQVNFSYWIASTQDSQLKLFVKALDGPQNSTTRLLWDTPTGPKSTEQWNATNVNIKDLFQAKKFMLYFQGFKNSLDDVAALERIVVTELSAASVPSLDKLPNVTYSLEKNVENEDLCSGSTGITSSLSIFLVSTLAAIFVSLRF